MKKMLLSIAAVLGLGLAVVGSTYAFFSSSAAHNDRAIANTANVNIIYNGGTNISGNMPIVARKEDGYSTSVNIRTSTSAIKKINAEIYIDIQEMTSNLSISGFRWDVYGTISGTQVYENHGTFSGYNASSNHIVSIVPSYELSTSQTVFTIYLWLDGNNNTVGNNVLGGSFSGYIGAKSENITGIITDGS